MDQNNQIQQFSDAFLKIFEEKLNSTISDFNEKMGKETNISGFGQNIIKLQEDSKNEQ